MQRIRVLCSFPHGELSNLCGEQGCVRCTRPGGGAPRSAQRVLLEDPWGRRGRGGGGGGAAVRLRAGAPRAHTILISLRSVHRTVKLISLRSVHRTVKLISLRSVHHVIQCTSPYDTGVHAVRCRPERCQASGGGSEGHTRRPRYTYLISPHSVRRTKLISPCVPATVHLLNLSSFSSPYKANKSLCAGHGTLT